MIRKIKIVKMLEMFVEHSNSNWYSARHKHKHIHSFLHMSTPIEMDDIKNSFLSATANWLSFSDSSFSLSLCLTHLVIFAPWKLIRIWYEVRTYYLFCAWIATPKRYTTQTKSIVVCSAFQSFHRKFFSFWLNIILLLDASELDRKQ